MMINGLLKKSPFQHCLYCHKELSQKITWTLLMTKEQGTGLCHECEAQLEEINGETCKICSRPLAEINQQFVHEDICHDCYRWEQDEQFKGTLDKNISLYVYNDFMKELISRYKYRGDYLLAQAFSSKLKQLVNQRVCPSDSTNHQPRPSTNHRDGPSDSMNRQTRPGDSPNSPNPHQLFVPIPLSKEREWERGFNQAEALIVAAGLPPTRLLKRIHSEKQSKKSRIERIHLPQVFRIAEPINLTNKTIILFDDIYTTGSTLRHAAKILKENGASSVISLTIAR